VKKILFAAMLLASSAAFAGMDRDGRECFFLCGDGPHQPRDGGRDGDRDGANVTSAPEIDPASAMSGLALLAGGLVVLRGRKFEKTKA
jgi:hypothetical protein